MDIVCPIMLGDFRCLGAGDLPSDIEEVVKYTRAVRQQSRVLNASIDRLVSAILEETEAPFTGAQITSDVCQGGVPSAREKQVLRRPRRKKRDFPF